MNPRLCPKCGAKLVIKSKRGRRPFLACPCFPECRHTEPIPEYDLMHHIRHPELDLFPEEEPAVAVPAGQE